MIKLLLTGAGGGAEVGCARAVVGREVETGATGVGRGFEGGGILVGAERGIETGGACGFCTSKNGSAPGVG